MTLLPLPAPSQVWRSDRALTDGHVVAAVREAGVPVTELGLVAGAGALGLTGHWVGHGCRGRRRGSAGSLAAPPRPWHLCRPSLCRAVRARPPGRPSRGHHCVFPVLPPLLGIATPVLSPGCCMSGSAGGKGASCRSRGGWRHMWAGPDVPPPPPRLGLGCWVPAFQGFWGASRRTSVFEARVPREGSGHVPGLEGLRVHPAIPPCLSRCRASQTASCWL